MNADQLSSFIISSTFEFLLFCQAIDISYILGWSVQQSRTLEFDIKSCSLCVYIPFHYTTWVFTEWYSFTLHQCKHSNLAKQNISDVVSDTPHQICYLHCFRYVSICTQYINYTRSIESEVQNRIICVCVSSTLVRSEQEILIRLVLLNCIIIFQVDCLHERFYNEYTAK